MMHKFRDDLLLVLLLLLAGGCAQRDQGTAEKPGGQAREGTGMRAADQSPLVAVATVRGQGDSPIQGTVTFTQEGAEVTVVAHIEGAPPGLHGFHVHENGDCSTPDFSSAGQHFNPTGAPHGGPADMSHHAGDLGNIQIDSGGIGHLESKSHALTVAAGPNAVVGRAVILHERADDLKTQPGGDAGGRIACGVIMLRAPSQAAPDPPTVTPILYARAPAD